MTLTYTRQSSFSDGDTITAALFNDEYNQLVNAFAYSATSSSTGHQHDGTAAEGGSVHTIGDLDFLNKIVADSTNNRWGVFVEVSSAAVEQIRIQDGAIVPVTDNDIDLGTSSLEFKDLFIDGTAHVDTLDVDANGTVTGTFGVTGATTLSSTLAVTGAVTGSSTLQATTITATTAFVPDASDGAALGTSALEFSDLFLADGAVINFGDDQDVSLTHVADTGILLSSTDQLQFGDSGTYIYQSADGVLDLVSDTEIELTATTIDMNGALDLSGAATIGGAITGSSTVQGTTITATTAFVPDASDGAALGTSALEFSDLFLADGAVINFGDDQDVSLTHVADTGLLISSTDQLQFGDSGTYIYQSADGVLDLVSDTEIELTATTIDINGNVDVSGTLTVAGAVDFGDAALSNVGAVQLDSIAGDGDTNTSITFSGSDVITIATGGSGRLTIGDGALSPVTDNEIDLGTSSLEFKNAYFDGTVTSDAFAGPLTGDVTGNVSGTALTVTQAAQTNITSLGTLTALTVDDVAINGKVVTMTGSTDDTATVTVGTNGTLAITTVDTAAAAANMTLTADGTFEAVGTTITLDSGGAINLEPASGSAILLDGTISVDAGVVTGATSITSTAFVGALTGNVTGNASGTALTVTQAAQTNITSLGTLTALTVDDVAINGKVVTMTGSSSDTAVFTAGTNGTLSIVTTDDAAAAANIQITADGTVDIDSAGVLTLDSGAAINIEPAAGSAILLDGTISVDAGVVTGATSITSTAFVGDVTGTSSKATVTDSTANTNFPVVFHNESDGLLDDTGALRYNPSTGELLVPKLTVAGTTTTVDTVTMQAENAIIFEGATADAYETTLSIVDPTADHTQYLINQGGYIPVLAASTATAISSTPAELNILDGATVVVGEINALDLGSTAVGTAIASKAVILDSSKDYTGLRNLTITGELDAATLDISGAIDVAGTSNLDVVDIDGAVDMASTLQVDGAITNSSTIVSTGKITADAGIDIDNFNIDGTTIALSSGDQMTLDSAGRIDLSADDNGEIRFFDGSLQYATFSEDDSRLKIKSVIQDADMLLCGDDNGTEICALTLDMSDAGKATFNDDVVADNFETVAGGTFTTASGNDLNLVYPDGRSLFIKEASTTSVTIDNAQKVTLAGALDVTGETTLATHLNMGDNDNIKLGGSADLTIHHNASHAIMNNTTGQFQLRGDDLRLMAATGNNDEYLVCTADGEVQLYFNGAEKLNTVTGGIDVTGTVTQSTAKTKYFTGQYDGREETTITLGSLGFKPQVLFCIFNVGTGQQASWGMSARDGGQQALLDYDLQAAGDGYEATSTYFGRLAFGSAVFSNLVVSSWNADDVVIQKVIQTGSSATCVYKITVMG